MGREPANSIRRQLENAGDRDRVARADRAAKKNYAERLSRELAQLVADGLRAEFPGILPSPEGRGQESRARTARGFKKLDVNYSTPELGLGLGVSIKTLNFVDPRTERYTKNYTRIDNELRAEAMDYHRRQPYAVLVALVFLPSDACDDGTPERKSSLAKAIEIFRFRAGREHPNDLPELFERIFLMLYETAPERLGELTCLDVRDKVPKHGRPQRNIRTLAQVLQDIVATYDRRNKPRIEWDE